jgi:uncharacterized protein YecA (UPF0149 family)
MTMLQALGLRPEDVFTAEMLAVAMEESSLAFEQELMSQPPQQQQQRQQHMTNQQQHVFDMSQ